MRRDRHAFSGRLANWLERHEQNLKWSALALGIASTVAIVQNWQPWPMVFGLPFCLIWVLCAWLRTERQLKYINLLFTALYVYGLLRWLALQP
ncbi:peptidase [Jannaschia sp. S6380]|uniref:peptidase n=1 Tax=Jannaschia sp. S6380 TaxID=2926408 RepID=UPI001FF2ABCE|nr:peptidase [Jannaschia sp. S6380]MCK0169214.1 peptidase [Jannaschia sp. S6380]